MPAAKRSIGSIGLAQFHNREVEVSRRHSTTFRIIRRNCARKRQAKTKNREGDLVPHLSKATMIFCGAKIFCRFLRSLPTTALRTSRRSGSSVNCERGDRRPTAASLCQLIAVSGDCDRSRLPQHFDPYFPDKII